MRIISKKERQNKDFTKELKEIQETVSTLRDVALTLQLITLDFEQQLKKDQKE